MLDVSSQVSMQEKTSRPVSSKWTSKQVKCFADSDLRQRPSSMALRLISGLNATYWSTMYLLTRHSTEHLLR